MAVLKLRYVGGDSFIHLMNPAAKLLILFLVVLSVFMYGPAVNAALAALIFLLYAAGGIGIKRYFSGLKLLPFFVVLIVAANVIFLRDGQSFLSHAAGGLLQGLKVLVLITSAGFFLAVTDPVDLSDSIVSVLKPLESIGLRREDISLFLMIVFSFLPHITEEAERIKTARLVRCGRGSWLSGKRGGVVPFLAPLIASLLRRAGELELALRARQYGTGSGRILNQKQRMSAGDISVIIIAVLLFSAGLYAKY